MTVSAGSADGFDELFFRFEGLHCWCVVFRVSELLLYVRTTATGLRCGGSCLRGD